MHKPALAFVITFGEGGGITEPRKHFLTASFFDDFDDDGRFIPVAKFVFLFFGLHRQTRQTPVEMERGTKDPEAQSFL